MKARRTALLLAFADLHRARVEPVGSACCAKIGEYEDTITAYGDTFTQALAAVRRKWKERELLRRERNRNMEDV
jgi:hypothetical protein